MITQKELTQILHYCPITGIFTWIFSNSSRVRVGDIAGSISKKGYLVIGINGKVPYAHHLAWLYMTGKWPAGIDHEDHDTLNNKFYNLAEANQQKNMKNVSLRKTSTSGVTGISWNKARCKWVAYIHKNGKFIGLGYFSDKFEAICARMSANNKYGFHKNHGRSPFIPLA